jgi:uncharacterized FlgJ-related protein
MMDIDQLIYDKAIKEGFTPTSAKFVVAQARHETANYTSNVFKRTNNLFGMKFVNQPLAISDNKKSPENDYYAHYRSPKDSVDDAIGRLFNITMRGVTPTQLKNAKTPEEYSNLQKKRGYFGDKVEIYIKGIKNALNKISVRTTDFYTQNKGKSDLTLGIVLISLALFITYKISKAKTK